ncbi:hypothetical protein FB107DRAFT_217331 [Schizophyllum commune]
MASPSQEIFQCPICPAVKCTSQSGFTRHMNAAHRDITPVADGDEDPAKTTIRTHPLLTGEVVSSLTDDELTTVLSGLPCDVNGRFLPPGSTPPPPPPPPPPPASVTDDVAWHPFRARTEFDFADYHFVEQQTSVSEIRKALDHWTATLLPHGQRAPWKDEKELYATIDAIQSGSSPWTCVKMRYTGERPSGVPPRWMTQEYELYTRDSRTLLHQQLSSEQFKDSLTPTPYRQFDSAGNRVLSNFMSGDWAWDQADEIAKDPATHGSMFVGVIGGSDKTTVSVATGHQEYHPVYMSPGCITNTARRGHGSGVLPVAMLPIPKANKRQRRSVKYQRFCRQLYHACLARVFRPLKAGMTAPEVVLCADGHYRRVVYGLGPYIADYPEQVWLAGIVQGWCPKCGAMPHDLDGTNARRRTHEKTDFLISVFDPGTLWSDFGVRDDVVPFTHEFPRADIHELLSPDLLHQVIKGTFKDHLVTWVYEYLVLVHGETRAKEIMDDIDRRISAVPSFPGLRRFPEGRDFAQWTGDDSKALMKVFLAAIAGHVPADMCRAFSSFLDFCYIARRNAITAPMLVELQAALDRFHRFRQVFIDVGIREDISLPRQHSLKHYARSIRLFGSPNGLCSSITESKHIKAVKEPWRRSSHYNALSQMLVANVRLDKVNAARLSFQERGMMHGTTSSYTSSVLAGKRPDPRELQDEEDEEEGAELGGHLRKGPRALSSVDLARTRARGYPRDLDDLAAYTREPRLPLLLRRFLHDQLGRKPSAAQVSHTRLPLICSRIYVHHSAVARFYAPSDLCGPGGMRRERIRSTPSWYGLPRRDTVLIDIGADDAIMKGMNIGRVHLFLSFKHNNTVFPCALIHWHTPTSDLRDDETGMWMVVPEYMDDGSPALEVVHIESIARGVHLIGACGSSFLPDDLHYSHSLDAFQTFYVNHYSDHHMHEFLYQ